MPIRKFIRWLVVHRLLWVLVAGVSAVNNFPHLYKAADFYFYSIESHAVVTRHGIDVESLKFVGRGVGPWEEKHDVPWIDLQVNIPERGAVPCQIAGQLGVFGRYVSDNPIVLDSELKKLSSSAQEFMRVFFRENVGQELRCAASRDVGLSVGVYLFVPFFVLAIWLLALTFIDIARYWKSRTTAGNPGYWG